MDHKRALGLLAVPGVGLVLAVAYFGFEALRHRHVWVRERREDGSYGLRCAECPKRYPKTWNDLIENTDGQGK